MNIANKGVVLLLTGTVNINSKHFTAHKNATVRKNEYIGTIKYYLSNYPFPVIFTENSGEDLTPYFKDEIAGGRLEILCFDGNNYSPEIGKGLGEMKCIEYAVNNAALITDDCFVYKITGRYVIMNLPAFINSYTQNPSLQLLADLTNNFKFSSAAIFGFRPFFAKKFLFKNTALINDTKEYYFEHALAKAVLEAIADNIVFAIFKHYPKIKAVSGTTGKPYKKSFFFLLPRQIKYRLRYFIVNR